MTISAFDLFKVGIAGQGDQDAARDGADMKDKYKETARGGLALNVVEC
jgi:hypothetical protein